MVVLGNHPNVAVVDDQDFATVSGKRWYLSPGGYVMRSERGRIFYLHRVVLDAPAGVQVDHINGNALDNRRCNLRLCTQSLNNANKASVSASGFRGVYRDKTHRGARVWRAMIGKGRTKKNLGSYATPEDAARAYDREARTRFGEFARLNFPGEAA